MNSLVKRMYVAALVVLVAAACGGTALDAGSAHATEIKYIVNNTTVVTSDDIRHRIAFLRLQRKQASAKAAADELIDQALHLQEAKRLGVDVSDSQVDQAYRNFAASNHVSAAQVDAMLQQSGVTKQHFREFLRATIAWNGALRQRYQSTSGQRSLEQEAVQWMLSRGGKKPSSTEYTLQRIIFVVPERDRSRILAKREREADAMRKRYSGCDSARDLAKETIDVTVLDFGRMIEEELPPEWKKQVLAAHVGGATTTRVTPQGVEFLGVCSTRTVSDDHVAELVYQQEHARRQRPEGCGGAERQIHGRTAHQGNDSGALNDADLPPARMTGHDQIAADCPDLRRAFGDRT